MTKFIPALLLCSAAYAAPLTLSPKLLIGRKSATVTKGSQVAITLNESTTTAALRVGLSCDRGASLRAVATTGGTWNGRGTGRYRSPDDEPLTFDTVRLSVDTSGIGNRPSKCTFFVYNAEDKSYEGDSYAAGQVNFVNLNNHNELAIRDCLQQQFAAALSTHGVNNVNVKVWLPASSGYDAPDRLSFRVTASETFGGPDVGYELALLSTSGKWAYSHVGGNIGGVGVSQYSYQTQGMNRLGYVLAVDGSDQPLFRIEAGKCWGN